MPTGHGQAFTDHPVTVVLQKWLLGSCGGAVGLLHTTLTWISTGDGIWICLFCYILLWYIDIDMDINRYETGYDIWIVFISYLHHHHILYVYVSSRWGFLGARVHRTVAIRTLAFVGVGRNCTIAGHMPRNMISSYPYLHEMGTQWSKLSKLPKGSKHGVHLWGYLNEKSAGHVHA